VESRLVLRCGHEHPSPSMTPWAREQLIDGSVPSASCQSR
jgi:hypothetical protein